MSRSFTLGRSVAVTLALLIGLVGSVAPISAGHRAQAAGYTRFAGLISDVTGPAGAPTAFTLQYKDRFVAMHTPAKTTTFQAKSAEAEVEGLLPGDYAVVLARHLKKGWTAFVVTFDVRPFAGLRNQLLLTGTILRVAPTGRQFSLRLDSGGTRAIKVLLRTKFFLDGQPIDPPPGLAKGTYVQVVLRKSDTGWFAFLINVRTTQPSHQARQTRGRIG